MTATTQKVVADRQYEKKITAYDCYMSVSRIVPNTIYMSLAWVVGPQEVEEFKMRASCSCYTQPVALCKLSLYFSIR